MAKKVEVENKSTCDSCNRIIVLRPHLDPKRKYWCSPECKAWDIQLTNICARLPKPTHNNLYLINLTERKDGEAA